MKSTILAIAALSAVLAVFMLSQHSEQLSNHLSVQVRVNNCNQTDFQYRDIEKSYGNDRQLNITLEQLMMINSPSNFGTVTLKTDSEQYNISVKKINLTEINTNRTAKYVPPNYILIEGQFVEISLEFFWQVININKTQKKGTAISKGISKELAYSIIGYQHEGFGLGNITALTFGNLSIISFATDDQPPTDQQKAIINNLLNKGTTNQTSLKQSIQKWYQMQMRDQMTKALILTHMSTLYSYQYSWKRDRPFDIDFQRYNKRELHVDQTGSYFVSRTDIRDLDQQKCGPYIGDIPLNPNTYGVKQQFTSYTVLENSLAYIMLEYQRLDTNLSRNSWGSKNFNFTAGQLSTAFSNITNSFVPMTQANGACNTSDVSKIKISKSSNTSINVNFDTKCQLKIKDTKIVEFDLALQFEAQGIALSNETLFKSKSIDFNSTYNDSFGFKLQNKVKADQFVRSTVEVLLNSWLIGSGWPLFDDRENPVFLALQNAFAVYDNPKPSTE